MIFNYLKLSTETTSTWPLATEKLWFATSEPLEPHSTCDQSLSASTLYSTFTPFRNYIAISISTKF